MSGLVRWTLVVVAAIVVVAVAAMLAVPFLVDTPRVQALIAGTASRALGRPVRFSSMSVKGFPLPAVELRDLEVADDPRFGTTPVLKLERGDVRLRLGALVRRHVEFGGVILRKPFITVIQDAAGRWNFASLGASAETAGQPRPSTPGRGRNGVGGGSGAVALLGSKVVIEDGVVTYLARGSSHTSSQYRLEGVNVTITGAPGTLGAKGTALVKPGDVTVTVKNVALALDRTRTLTEAPVSGQLALDGKDVKDLVAVMAGPSPALSAALKATLTLAGTVGSPRASGPVELRNPSVTRVNPACPAPKQRTLALGTMSLPVAWDSGEVVVRPLTTKIGNGTISTNVFATLESGSHVELRDLALHAIPLKTVLVDFLCEGYAVDGPLDLTGTLAFDPRNTLASLSGRGAFRIGSGKVVGSQALATLGNVARLGGAVSGLLGGDVPSLGGSPLAFDSITGTFTIANGVATTHDVRYASQPIKISAAGDYGIASGRINMDMVLTHARGEVQAKVTGNAASPSVRVVPGSVLRGVDREGVQKGLENLLRQFK